MDDKLQMHQKAVAERCASFYGKDSLEYWIGLYHDMVEDGYLTAGEVVEEIWRKSHGKFSEDEIADAITGITRTSDETYFDYITRCSDIPVAARVKIVDLHENRYWRGDCPKTLSERYDKAIKFLDSKGYGLHYFKPFETLCSHLKKVQDWERYSIRFIAAQPQYLVVFYGKESDTLPHKMMMCVDKAFGLHFEDLEMGLADASLVNFVDLTHEQIEMISDFLQKNKNMPSESFTKNMCLFAQQFMKMQGLNLNWKRFKYEDEFITNYFGNDLKANAGFFYLDVNDDAGHKTQMIISQEGTVTIKFGIWDWITFSADDFKLTFDSLKAAKSIAELVKEDEH